MIICQVCGGFVETDGDVADRGDGSVRNIAVPLEGVSIRCESCSDFCHVDCSVGDECRLCAAVTA
jgi:hypothetical protein